jgi:cell division protein FtsW
MDIRREFDDYQHQEESLVEAGGTFSPFTFLCVVLLITSFGLIMLYSASTTRHSSTIFRITTF